VTLFLSFTLKVPSSTHFAIYLLNTLHLKTFTIANMKEALISTGPKVEIVDTPIPKAGRDQVVIKVVYSGSNPKDWKIPGALHSLAFQRGEPID
jgi:hypothetical protein